MMESDNHKLKRLLFDMLGRNLTPHAYKRVKPKVAAVIDEVIPHQ